MTEPTGACYPATSIEQLRAAFLDILPGLQTHASVYFRGLKCPGKRDDAIAEAVGVARKWHTLPRRSRDSVACRWPGKAPGRPPASSASARQGQPDAPRADAGLAPPHRGVC